LADTFHMNIEEVSIPQALEFAAERLGHVHLVDSNRRAPGQGHIDFAACAAALRRTGYAGYLCAEILPWPDSRQAASWAREFYRQM
jgi:sugar phosphate isomerase/epimerase